MGASVGHRSHTHDELNLIMDDVVGIARLFGICNVALKRLELNNIDLWLACHQHSDIPDSMLIV